MITMETMKASRRKQTKPNRVPFGVDPDSGAYNASMSAPQPPPGLVSHEDDRPRYNGGGGGGGGDHEDGDGPLDMHVPLLSCKLCPETFSSSSDLREHVDIAHGSASASVAMPPKRPRMDSEFPTAYHRLGSELFQENSLLPNGHSADDQPQALSLTKPKPSHHHHHPHQPHHHQHHHQDPREFEDSAVRDLNGEGRSVKVDGGKIFHLDAYCELCDREFCNKYFLKTHKANKHGIYDSESPSTPLPPDGGGPPTPYDLTPLPGGPPPKVEMSHSPWLEQQQRQTPSKKDSGSGRGDSRTSPSNSNNNNNPSGGSNSKKSEIDLDTEKKVSSVITAVMNSMSNSGQSADGGGGGGGGSGKNYNSSSGGGGGNSGSSSSTKDPSMEDYCEFCQKHFCNKYYLKKHKQDVHGIIPETGPTTTKRSRASSNLLDLPMSTSMGSPMLLPQPMASLGGMPALPPGVMVLNPFMPQMTIIPTGNMPQPMLHAHQLHHPPQSPGLMSQALPMPGAIPGVSPTTPTSQASQLSPSLETYCSQCRKEFSNAYFLKIHRANRHGVHSDEIPPEAKMLGDMVESNGVVIPPRPSSKDLVKQEGLSRSSPPPLTSIFQMVYCRQCDKDFPNAHSFKMHQITEHGKNLEASLPDGFESSLPKSEPPVSMAESLRRMSGEAPSAHSNGSNGSGGQTMFGNIVAAKLADRVVCDICNKDLCNKYFLKSHKLKMHGIDVDKEEGRASSGGDKSQQQSPTAPGVKAQPINMSMNTKPPLGLMPKLELKDFPDYSRDLKMMEKYGGLKNFPDVPTFLSETINNEYLRRTHPQPPFKGLDFGMQSLGHGPTGNLSHDQLVEEGIDPEAYCDICKKEFCSKYFLRTHKQNIHGIKVETPPVDRSRAKPGPKPTLSKLNSLGGNSVNPMVLPMPGMPFSFPPGLMMGGIPNGGGPGSLGGGGGASRARDSFEKHQFRWKDPSNSQRVTCDICNKEVCNKYFLRTHKLKKHGIAPSDTSLSPMSGSPVPSENDASSNHSSQPDNFLLDKGVGLFPRTSEGMGVPQTIPLPPSERSGKPGSGDQARISSSRSEEEKAYLQSKMNNNNNNNNNGSSLSHHQHHHHYQGRSGGEQAEAVTCHLCDRKFRSLHWLSAHVMKDHAEAVNPDLMDLRMLPPPLGPAGPLTGDLEPKVCQVCRVLLPNEISLQLHLIQEHNALVKLQMEDSPRVGGGGGGGHKRSVASPSPSGALGSSRTSGLKAAKPWRSAGRKKQGLSALRRQKMYVCSSCDYASHWLSKLQAHEESEHASSSPSSSAGRSSNSKLGAPSSNSAEPGVPANSSSNSGFGLKQFKCGLCTSRFSTHAYCQMHLREAHIHMLKDFASRQRERRAAGTSGKRLLCSLCPFSTSFPFRLHSHVCRYHRRHSSGPNPASSLSSLKKRAAAAAENLAVSPALPMRPLELSMGVGGVGGGSGGGERDGSPPRGVSGEDLASPPYDRPGGASAAGSEEELMKQTFQMMGEEGEGSLSDKFMASMPMRQRIHEPVAASYRMTEVTP